MNISAQLRDSYIVSVLSHKSILSFSALLALPTGALGYVYIYRNGLIAVLSAYSHTTMFKLENPAHPTHGRSEFKPLLPCSLLTGMLSWLCIHIFKGYLCEINWVNF